MMGRRTTKAILLPFRLVRGSELVEEFGVHLHECFENIEDECHDRLVPVLLRDAIERRKHDRHDRIVVLLDQRENVLVVPEEECSFRNLGVE